MSGNVDLHAGGLTEPFGKSREKPRSDMLHDQDRERRNPLGSAARIVRRTGGPPVDAPIPTISIGDIRTDLRGANGEVFRLDLLSRSRPAVNDFDFGHQLQGLQQVGTTLPKLAVIRLARPFDAGNGARLDRAEHRHRAARIAAAVADNDRQRSGLHDHSGGLDSHRQQGFRYPEARCRRYAWRGTARPRVRCGRRRRPESRGRK